jgi:pilus assembly protein Flp/PilA
MKNLFLLLGDETGATAIEYGLIASLISVACIAAMGVMGRSLSNVFNTVTAALEGGSAR